MSDDTLLRIEHELANRHRELQRLVDMYARLLVEIELLQLQATALTQQRQ